MASFEEVARSALVAFVAIARFATAQDTSIDALAFLEGNWERTTDGMHVEQVKHFENDYVTYEDRNGVGPRTCVLVDLGAGVATFEEQTGEGGFVHLRYRLTDDGQLGIAVGSPDDFAAGTFAESLHSRTGGP